MIISEEAIQAEQDRQSQILVDAIYDAIRGCAFETPMVNAIAGALVTIEAAVLASVHDPALRRALKKEMDRHRPAALARAVASRDRMMSVETVQIGGSGDVRH